MNIRDTAKLKKEQLTTHSTDAPSVEPDFVEGYVTGFKDAIAQFKHMVQCVQINDGEQVAAEAHPAPPAETT